MAAVDEVDAPYDDEHRDDIERNCSVDVLRTRVDARDEESEETDERVHQAPESAISIPERDPVILGRTHVNLLPEVLEHLNKVYR